MDKTFAYTIIAAFIFVAVVVTKTSDVLEYRNLFCRIILKSMIALMWISIAALITLVMLY